MYGQSLVRDDVEKGIDLSVALVELSSDDGVSDPLSGRTWSERIGVVVHIEDGEIAYLRMEIRVIASTSAQSSNIIEEIEQQLGATDSSGTIRNALSNTAVITVTGDLVMLESVLKGLNESQVESTAISLGVSFAVLFLLTRRIMPAMLTLAPVALATLWVVGSMVIFGLNWNVLTVMVTALTIGIGIDYSIHIWRRFEIECAEGDDPWEAMKRTLATTGVALALSSGTTMCGFMVLLLSPMPVIRDFGLVTSLTVLFSFILSVMVLPILLVMSASKGTETSVAQ
jgi:predicted RND superfamily exporter protein